MSQYDDVETLYLLVPTIQSDLGAERTNWDVLFEKLQSNGFAVIAPTL